ncbi:PREDICTED: uncharacterized protein LOC109184147 [Ipomoea nil]|uniref:uncharacterized protein LOC109184147 n=1 Tax=Ipomoea nil TaxID=35883 RepID=UPI000900D515|nr:PREDICTED: uncharacterized protein LOC109184147 [Ipomoea nil]
MDCLLLGFLEMCSVHLIIHHGGNFVKGSELQYINGDVVNVDIDSDLLSYPHLVKFIKEGQYGKIETLYYKAVYEPLDKLRVLWNDATVLDLTALAIRFKSCDIYVDHGIDEADLIPSYLLLGCEGNDEVNEETNEGDCNVGEGDDEGNWDGNDEGNWDGNDEGNEGDEEDNDSDEEDNQHTDFDNDIGGVTQEDGIHINVNLQYDEENDCTVKCKGKGKGNGKVKTTKAKDIEVSLEGSKQKKTEGEACSDDYYYDSADPPTQESEEEEVTQHKTPPSNKFRLPSYNPECDFPELEKGMLFEDVTQFKAAMIKYAVHFKRDVYFYKNESMRDAKAKEDLANYPAKFWCKAFMRTEVKCDSVDNNMCEAFNGTIVKARSKPIVKMLEDIRVATMTRIARCRKVVDKWPGNFGPRIMKKLNENIVESIGWHVDFNGDDGYEIKKGRQQFKVKLKGKSCSCRSWDLTGKDPEQYIDDCYSNEVYKKIYSHTIQPLNGEISWPRTNSEEILAPKPRPMTGTSKESLSCKEFNASCCPIICCCLIIYCCLNSNAS